MRKGQTLVEYLVAMVGLLAVVGALWGLVNVARRYAVRTENLVSSEYP